METLSHHLLQQRIVEGAQKTIRLADGEGVVRLWNTGAEHIFGFTATEALGERLDLIDPDKLPEMFKTKMP